MIRSSNHKMLTRTAKTMYLHQKPGTLVQKAITNAVQLKYRPGLINGYVKETLKAMNKSINDDCENRKKQLNKIMKKIRL